MSLISRTTINYKWFDGALIGCEWASLSPLFGNGPVLTSVHVSLVEKRIQARRNGGSALGRSLSTPHAPSQYTSASASTYSTARRSDEKPSNDLTATATKTRYAGPRPVMITLPSSPSPQNTPDSAHRRGSSLGSTSPTANASSTKIT
jgi:hypothetical protein